MRITPADYVKAKRLRLKQLGIVYPATTVAEARRTGLELAVALALLQQESGGGRNVFGHDPVDNIRGGVVTYARYRQYLVKRGRDGRGGMQGVGPCQLTWWAFQDEADRMGGCWLPWINMRVGFGHLAQKIKAHGLAAGLAAYNGSGAGAWLYEKQVMARVQAWRGKLK